MFDLTNNGTNKSVDNYQANQTVQLTAGGTYSVKIVEMCGNKAKESIPENITMGTFCFVSAVNKFFYESVFTIPYELNHKTP